MTEQTTGGWTPFGRVLSVVMESSGLATDPGAIKELAERSGLDAEGFVALATSDPRMSLGDLGGLAEVLELSKPEMDHVALAYAFDKEIPCGEPGCTRPAVVGDEFGDCAEHRAAYDAKADHEAWCFARRILEPWNVAAREIGSDEVTRVMEKALGEVEEALAAAHVRLERAESAAD